MRVKLAFSDSKRSMACSVREKRSEEKMYVYERGINNRDLCMCVLFCPVSRWADTRPSIHSKCRKRFEKLTKIIQKGQCSQSV
jgi:hypothetical protein